MMRSESISSSSSHFPGSESDHDTDSAMDGTEEQPISFWVLSDGIAVVDALVGDLVRPHYLETAPQS